jgi:hypothetical protein
MERYTEPYATPNLSLYAQSLKAHVLHVTG